MGFSDARLAILAGIQERDVAALRKSVRVHPVFKRIDTCAAEFAALTSYMYSTYEAPSGGEVECESRPREWPESHHSWRRTQPDRSGDRI